MRKLLASACLAWIACSPVEATDLAWMGPGAQSCTQYLKAADASELMRDTYFFWAQGFMSGLNTILLPRKSHTNLAASTTGDQQAYIDRFCNGRPLASYSEAVIALFDEMRLEQRLPDWRSLARYPGSQ